MTKFILRWAINAIALYLAVLLLPGRIGLTSGLVSIIWLALIFGLVNALVRPLISILTCPLIILTLGLFTLVINDPVWLNAFLGGLVVSVVSVVLSMILKDELKPRRPRS